MSPLFGFQTWIHGASSLGAVDELSRHTPQLAHCGCFTEFAVVIALGTNLQQRLDTMSIPKATCRIRLWSVLIAAILVTGLARPSDAQILVWPPEPEETEAAEKEQSEKILRFDAAAEPEPALRYRFWPIAGQETSGNAMALFQRANLMRLEQRVNDRPEPFYDNNTQWLSDPLDELPRDAVREYLEANEAILAEIRRAASMKSSEYEIGLNSLNIREAINLPLTDFQHARDLARLLQLQIRLAIAEQRYEDAVRSLRSGFRLAETVGQASDLLIGRLIGFAISGMMLGSVEEMIAQPESPNLYWALASLPPSVWEIRRSLEYELNLNARVFPHLTDLPRESTLSDATWRDRLIESAKDFLTISAEPVAGFPGSSGDDRSPEEKLRVQAQLVAGALVLAFDASARNYLQKVGYSSDAAEAMPPSEAVLRATHERLLRLQGDYAKWGLLPPQVAVNVTSRAEEAFRANANFPDPAIVIVGLLMPAVEAAQSAAVRAEQSVAFLATIEALRMHAAEHGEFPESLQNLHAVPAFPDPATGEPFVYERITGTEVRLERKPAHPGQRDTALRLELRN